MDGTGLANGDPFEQKNPADNDPGSGTTLKHKQSEPRFLIP
jgi:hypothetical protein